MYFALVRPIIENVCSVWDPHTKHDIERIEMIQHRAARFVAKNYQRAPGTMTHILNKLKWPTLQQRRKERRLTVMFKLQNSLVSIPIPDYVGRQNTPQTRQYHPNKFRVMAPKKCVQIQLLSSYNPWLELLTNSIAWQCWYWGHKKLQSCSSRFKKVNLNCRLRL